MPRNQRIPPIAPGALNNPPQNKETKALGCATRFLAARNDQPDPLFPRHPRSLLNLDARHAMSCQSGADAEVAQRTPNGAAHRDDFLGSELRAGHGRLHPVLDALAERGTRRE